MNKRNAFDKFSQGWPWLIILILIVVAIILWQPLSSLWQPNADDLLKERVEQLGPLAPVAFLALSIIQIVGAPIPGYPVQFLGGYLFGPIWGGFYNVIGLLGGGFIAAWLARQLGRPFIERQISPEVLAQYERLAHLETLWMWFILLTLPVGDIPYFLAGLSRVKFSTLVWATLLARGPFSFFFAWIGHETRTVPTWIFGLVSGFILILILLAYRFKDRLSLWLNQHLLPS